MLAIKGLENSHKPQRIFFLPLEFFGRFANLYAENICVSGLTEISKNLLIIIYVS